MNNQPKGNLKPRTELYILEDGVQRRVLPGDPDAWKATLRITIIPSPPGTKPHPRPARTVADLYRKPEPPPAA